VAGKIDGDEFVAVASRRTCDHEMTLSIWDSGVRLTGLMSDHMTGRRADQFLSCCKPTGQSFCRRRGKEGANEEEPPHHPAFPSFTFSKQPRRAEVERKTRTPKRISPG